MDSNGTLAVSYEYNAWGKLISSSRSGTSGTTLKNANALLYRGYYYDSDLGMYYLQSRFYDPTLCRFVNADEPDYSEAAATNLSDTNLFAYCRNNPVIRADEDGELSEIVTGVIIGALIGAGVGMFTSAIGAAMTGDNIAFAMASGLVQGAALGNVSAMMTIAAVPVAIGMGVNISLGMISGGLSCVFNEKINGKAIDPPEVIASSIWGGIGVLSFPTVSTSGLANAVGTYFVSLVTSVGSSMTNAVKSTLDTNKATKNTNSGTSSKSSSNKYEKLIQRSMVKFTISKYGASAKYGLKGAGSGVPKFGF